MGLQHDAVSMCNRPLVINALYGDACQHDGRLIGRAVHLFDGSDKCAIRQSKQPATVTKLLRVGIAETVVGIEETCIQLAIVPRVV